MDADAMVVDPAQLRVLTCGSVDDGKSTLIGRLLYDCGQIPDDHLAALRKDSQRFGTRDGALDFALLVDGLEAEREQGITIDVAYRYFSTPRRSFIFVDAPGHEQYTRNMATGASTAAVAVVLVDAQKGIRAQTQRHSFICSQFGIRHVVLAVNKMDLVGFSHIAFEGLCDEYLSFAKNLRFRSVLPIPLSATSGENVASRSGNMPWYQGPTFLECLEEVDAALDPDDRPFRMHVQLANRPDASFRGGSGTVASGRVCRGDRVVVAQRGQSVAVDRIVGPDGDLDAACAGQPVTLCFDEDVDVSRGDLLASDHARPSIVDQFAAHVFWMGEDPLIVGRSYLLRIGTQWTVASVTRLNHRVDVSTLGAIAARTLAKNDFGVGNFSVAEPIAFDPFEENQSTGAFILVDRQSNDTVACGTIDFPLRRASNVHKEAFLVDKSDRSELMGQRPAVLWFTGLSGAGKSTIAKAVESKLHARGWYTYALDGDNLRHGLNRDLGFTESDRVENIRRVAEVAALFVDAGLVVLCSFISPYRAERQLAREKLEREEFIEIYVDTPLEECMRRDPKGLYAKAVAGSLKNFTGVDSPYEPPLEPELHIVTTSATAEELANRVVEYFLGRD